MKKTEVKKPTLKNAKATIKKTAPAPVKKPTPKLPPKKAAPIPAKKTIPEKVTKKPTPKVPAPAAKKAAPKMPATKKTAAMEKVNAAISKNNKPVSDDVCMLSIAKSLKIPTKMQGKPALEKAIKAAIKKMSDAEYEGFCMGIADSDYDYFCKLMATPADEKKEKKPKKGDPKPGKGETKNKPTKKAAAKEEGTKVRKAAAADSEERVKRLAAYKKKFETEGCPWSRGNCKDAFEVLKKNNYDLEKAMKPWLALVAKKYPAMVTKPEVRLRGIRGKCVQLGICK